MAQRISGFILMAFSLLISTSALAQVNQGKGPQDRGKRGDDYHIVQFDKDNPPPDSLRNSKPRFISGISVSGDLLGLILADVAPYGQIEGALRLNIKQTYFPIVELGLGISDHTNDVTETHFKTHSPYFRLGADYNFIKNKKSGNRIYGGFRYAFSSFSYDLNGKDLYDPVWGTTTPYDFKGLKSTVQWMELVFGLEAKIWGNFHLGWSVRYRKRLSQSISDVGQAWYIPGFGKNDTHTFGGTFNVIFDI